jgi:hypothetical protein
MYLQHAQALQFIQGSAQGAAADLEQLRYFRAGCARFQKPVNDAAEAAKQ